MPFFDQLIAATETARNELQGIHQLQAGVKGDISLTTYTAFLTQAYHHVKHTVPLLMACGSRLTQHPARLRNAILEYIDEEKGHEEWILNDLRACGVNAESVRHGRPAAETELMVAYAYHTIERIDPVAFFGMVLVLEGTSVKMASQAAAGLKGKLQLPDSAFSYLTSHGALDIEHMGFFEKLMNGIERQQTRDAIIHCANMMYRLYGNIFRSLPA